jgi:hypothetical protein
VGDEGYAATNLCDVNSPTVPYDYYDNSYMGSGGSAGNCVYITNTATTASTMTIQNTWNSWNNQYVVANSTGTGNCNYVTNWNSWNRHYEETEEQRKAREEREARWREDEERRWQERQARLEEERKLEEARRKAAKDKARKLLLEALDETQREEFNSKRFFHVTSKTGKRYRLEYGVCGNIKEVDERGAVQTILCAHPKNVPCEDSLFSQKLALENDENTIRKVANVHFNRELHDDEYRRSREDWLQSMEPLENRAEREIAWAAVQELEAQLQVEAEARERAEAKAGSLVQKAKVALDRVREMVAV